MFCWSKTNFGFAASDVWRDFRVFNKKELLLFVHLPFSFFSVKSYLDIPMLDRLHEAEVLAGLLE